MPTIDSHCKECGAHLVFGHFPTCSRYKLPDVRCSECAQWVRLGHSLTCSRHPAATRSQQDGYGTPRDQGLAGLVPGFDDGPLREVRLWHWIKALQNRKIANEWRERGRHSLAEGADMSANFHIKAVQALNDCFEINDTAEQDAAK